MLKEAMLCTAKEDNKVLCHLCSHRCIISESKFGICGVRENKGGKLYTYAYGEVIAANIDPIEKKPIFHLLPGSKSFSIATVGCNFHCGFCQNWQISQKKEADRLGGRQEVMSPEEIVESAKRYKCESISYTYTEPTIFFEYAFETAKLAKEAGLFNVFVTNGYMTKDCLDTIDGFLDAANVDLKSFSDDYYKKVCGGRLEPVLESIRYMRKLNIWVEVTTLVVPSLNDSERELNETASFIASVGNEIPWHISRFHPDYKLTNNIPTPITTLKKAYKIGRDAGLRYVYLGNVPEEENTYCYNCKELLISRIGFDIIEYRLKNSKCPKCGAVLDGAEWR